MKQVTDQTRYEKCAEVLGTHYEEEGISRSTFHERLKIACLESGRQVTREELKERWPLTVESGHVDYCNHTMVCILTVAP